MRNAVSHLCRLLPCCLIAGLTGCTVIAAVLDKTLPEQQQPAAYVPQKDNMLVLVENYRNPATVQIEAAHMEHVIGEEMVSHNAAPIINPDRLMTMRAEHPQDFRKMKIPAIGAELGARQILYVDVTEFTVESAVGTGARKGHAEARVKVVDCRTGQTRWPRDTTSAGFPILIELPFGMTGEEVSESKVRTALSDQLASRVAELFYTSTYRPNSSSPKYPESDSVQ